MRESVSVSMHMCTFKGTCVDICGGVCVCVYRDSYLFRCTTYIQYRIVNFFIVFFDRKSGFYTRCPELMSILKDRIPEIVSGHKRHYEYGFNSL